MRVKELWDAEGGELVQFSAGNGMMFGIVAETHFGTNGPAKILICLGGLDDRCPPPRFTMIQAGESGISYGRDYAFVADCHGSVVNAGSLGRAANGALLIGPERTVLLVDSMGGSQLRGPLQYDVATGRTVKGLDLGQQYAVRSWEIRLEPEPRLEPPLPAVFRFPATKPAHSA